MFIHVCGKYETLVHADIMVIRHIAVSARQARFKDT